MDNRLLMLLPGIEGEELLFIRTLLKELSEKDKDEFLMHYRSRRKDPQLILLTALVGFVGIAGVHRFLTNQLGMGILYLLTAGLCFVGTIIDILNYKQLALTYNKQQAVELLNLINSLR